MKKPYQLILTCISLIVFSFQNIFAQPLFTLPNSDHLSPEVIETEHYKGHSVKEGFAINSDSEYIMPTSEQLDLIVTAHTELDPEMEEWMIEPECKGWEIGNEELVMLESWMYSPSEWLQ